MATELQIANGALIKLGGRTILAFTDAEKEAKLCNARYDACRQAVLRMHPWNFARARTTLDTPEVTAPEFEWENAFALPTDYLRVILVNEGEDEYIIENGQLLTNEPSVELRYVRDVGAVPAVGDREELPDPLFNEALSAYLAFDISYALTQSTEVRDAMFQVFRTALAIAKNASASENPAGRVDANDFIYARQARGGFVRDPGT